MVLFALKPFLEFDRPQINFDTKNAPTLRNVTKDHIASSSDGVSESTRTLKGYLKLGAQLQTDIAA